MQQGRTSDIINRAVGGTIEEPKKDFGNSNKTQSSNFKLGDP
jgi:hypothetical protein